MSSINRALGNISMFLDIIPTGPRDKLAAVDAGTAEFDYMLASILFDLVKKNALLHKALREFALHADPEATERLLRHVEEIEGLGQDYGAIARLTHSQMLEAVGETMDEHIELARTVVRWSRDEPPSGTRGA